MKRTIVVNGETLRFDHHHLCQSSLAGSDRMWVNVILLRVEVGDHTDVHAQASLFISDQGVQNVRNPNCPNDVESQWHEPF